MKMLKALIIVITLNPSCYADCTAFPIDVFINGIDPRFNLSNADAFSSVQTGIDYMNRNIGRNIVRLNSNGVPITFEWNDTSLAMSIVKRSLENMNNLETRIKTLKAQPLGMANDPGNVSNEQVAQINQLTDNYNIESNKVNNITAQMSAEALGTFSRVSSYASIKIFGYESIANLVHVLMHELGHMQGLGHTTGTVMDARTNSSFEFSFDDAARIRSEYDVVCQS